MKILSKNELNDNFGKIGFFESPIQLIAKVEYIGGIDDFDKILKGQKQNEIDVVIHLIKRPKGIQIKLAGNLTSNSVAILSDRVEKVTIEHKDSIIRNKERSVIGRAVVGGLLLGPIGAVVGGLSALKQGQEIILPDSIVTIHYKSDTDNAEIFFSCKKENLKDTSDFFKSIDIDVQELREAEKEITIVTDNLDKLERLAKLKADGHLTEEEFETQKKKLLK